MDAVCNSEDGSCMLSAEIGELRADLAAANAHILLLTVERDALRAKLARHEEAPSATMIRWSIMRDQLRELRVAATELEKRARTEAEFLQSEGYKRGMYLEQDCDEFKAVLLSPEQF